MPPSLKCPVSTLDRSFQFAKVAFGGRADNVIIIRGPNNCFANRLIALATNKVAVDQHFPMDHEFILVSLKGVKYLVLGIRVKYLKSNPNTQHPTPNT